MMLNFIKDTYSDNRQLTDGVHPEGQVCHHVVKRRRGGVSGGQCVAEPGPCGRGPVIGATGAGDGHADLPQMAPVEAHGAAARGVTQGGV